MAYQSFDGEKGDSNSALKLERIKMPEDLTGKTVLDIGCNEGFFCREAVRRGAVRVVGVDNNAALLERARQRTPEAEFVATDWWHLPAGNFDLILMLSAIHYEPDQRRLLQLILSRLEKNGLFILECGVVRDLKSKEWIPYQRGDGSLIYPTWRLLLEGLLEGYAVRDIGPSVQQAGDPVPREVFHCRRADPLILAIGGASGAGKTVAAREMARHGLPTIYTDFLMAEMAENPKGLRLPFMSYAKDNLVPNQIDLFVGKIVTDGKEEQFAEALLRYISPSDPMTVVEGFALGRPSIMKAFEAVATRRGFRVVTASA